MSCAQTAAKDYNCSFDKCGYLTDALPTEVPQWEQSPWRRLLGCLPVSKWIGRFRDAVALSMFDRHGRWATTFAQLKSFGPLCRSCPTVRLRAAAMWLHGSCIPAPSPTSPQKAAAHFESLSLVALESVTCIPLCGSARLANRDTTALAPILCSTPVHSCPHSFCTAAFVNVRFLTLCTFHCM